MEVSQINEMGCQNDSIPTEDQEENDQTNTNSDTNVQINDSDTNVQINENQEENDENNENQDLDGTIEETDNLSEGKKLNNNNNNENLDPDGTLEQIHDLSEEKKFNNNNNNNNKNLNKKTFSNNNSIFPDSYNEGDYGNFEKYSNIRNEANNIFLYSASVNGGKNEDNNNNNDNKNNNKNDNQNNLMTAGENLQKADVLKIIFSSLVSLLGLKRDKYDVLDSFVLRFHYQFGTACFYICFLLVWLGMYNKEPLACIGPGIDAKKYLKNICLSYSFYEMPHGTRKTIFFYRWAHFSCLVVALVFLLPKLLIKKLGNPRLKNVFSNIRKNSSRLDENKEENQIQTFMTYFKENIGTHKYFYHTYLFNHICCIIVTLFNFWFLNFVLQGEFASLVLNVFPFHRDPVNFRDPLSVIFPPFVTCNIGPPGKNMLSGRDDTFYCYFNLMELLEKVFIFAWVYMVVALVIGGISVIFLWCLRYLKKYLLRTKESSSPYRKLSNVLASNLMFGDIFVLYLVKKYLTADEFSKILIEILKFLKEDFIEKED